MRKLKLLALVFAGFSLSATAQTYKQSANGVELSTPTQTVKVDFYSPAIVRVQKAPIGKAYVKESLSVIKTPQKTAFSLSKNADEVTLKSQKLIVSINLN